MEFEFKGSKEFERNLKKVLIDLEGKIAMKGVRAAAGWYRKEMKKVIPMDTRDDIHLRKSIAVSKMKGRDVTGVNIGIKGAARHYAHVWEFGGQDGEYQGTGLFTKTFASNIQQMLDKMSDKLRSELSKTGFWRYSRG